MHYSLSSRERESSVLSAGRDSSILTIGIDISNSPPRQPHAYLSASAPSSQDELSLRSALRTPFPVLAFILLTWSFRFQTHTILFGGLGKTVGLSPEAGYGQADSCLQRFRTTGSKSRLGRSSSRLSSEERSRRQFGKA
ncbi:hypothetical protein PM082_006224 [Marasmius tenuissimus]|nr:hypothetical protein PM082_006224 [Marasmius tenuissimus]